MNTKKLEWEEKYSVGVKLIDNQHRQMFDTINLLLGLLGGTPTKEEINEIISRLIEYKKIHFSTEEGYFKEFNYENAEDHTNKHREFNTSLEKLLSDNKNDLMALAFSLVDFLENWLISHLMYEDQKYVSCFRDHGLV